MTGIDLATALNVEPRGLHYFDESDGRSAVVGGYTVGQSSLLSVGSILYRPPGSAVWLVRCDPRVPGDGPSYMIAVSVAARYRPLVSPPVPDLQARLAEDRSTATAFTRTQIALNESESRYWKQAAVSDLVDVTTGAPGAFAGGAGWLAGKAISAVTGVIGAGAGAFYGSLPFWIQVGIPILIAGAGLAGAAAVVRSVRTLAPGAGPGG